MKASLYHCKVSSSECIYLICKVKYLHFKMQTLTKTFFVVLCQSSTNVVACNVRREQAELFAIVSGPSVRKNTYECKETGEKAQNNKGDPLLVEIKIHFELNTW